MWESMIPYLPSFSLIHCFFSHSHLCLWALPFSFLPIHSVFSLSPPYEPDSNFPPSLTMFSCLIQSVTHPILVSPATSVIQQIFIEFLVCVRYLDTEADKTENQILPLACLYDHHDCHHHHACGSHPQDQRQCLPASNLCFVHFGW